MIELIVVDIDGTLTNGQIIYSSNNQDLSYESKAFDVKDGLALASWTKKFNKPLAVITGRSSQIVQKRMEELGARYIYQGIDNKDEIIEHILNQENITWENVATIGDDLNDYKMLQKAKISFAPLDCSDDIKDIVNIITPYKGGNGAVRYMINYILKRYYNKELKDLWV
jgi:3-deoxy-D-manno-octulosonate 8-phosphate phosphatase (KDO 8-P phosphatase)